MFNGAPDQFHHFITQRTTLPLHHLTFPLHASATTPNSFLPFDPHIPSHQLPLQATLLQPLHHYSPTHKDEEKEAISTVSSINFETERDQRQSPELFDSRANDEVLALFRIRSSMESCFPELTTWEHASRKLAEFGFKKSVEKCNEKLEDESRFFNNNINYGKSYQFLSELEEIYQGDQNPDHVMTEKNQQLEEPSEGHDKMGHALEEDSRNNDPPATKPCEGRSDKMVEKSKGKKRKRRDRYEIFKGFCESIVTKMMAQQEEIHNKLLEDMLKRDQESFAKEEAWKKQEMDRMDKQLEMMAQEQAVAGDRHAIIIEFLKKYAPSSPASQNLNGSKRNSQCTSSSSLHSQNLNLSTGEKNLEPTHSSNMSLNHETNGDAQNNLSLPTLAPENPSSSDTLQVPSSSNSSLGPHNPRAYSSTSQNNQLESNSISTFKASMSTSEKEDVGRRWPRNEVLALINLRCTSVNNNNNEDKEGNKTTLWERISQGMSELGYKRSAKRCKEKWENINKYFRKTKDVNKKRSLDSRTCPYFHQLRILYNQGKLVPQSERSENHLNPTAKSGKIVLPLDEAQAGSSQVGSTGCSMHVDHGGEKTLMQVPPLDFD